jgi:hypothetical protein
MEKRFLAAIEKATKPLLDALKTVRANCHTPNRKIIDSAITDAEKLSYERLKRSSETRGLQL